MYCKWRLFLLLKILCCPWARLAAAVWSLMSTFAWWPIVICFWGAFQRLCFLYRSHAGWRTEGRGGLQLILWEQNECQRWNILDWCFMRQATNKLRILWKLWLELNLTNWFSFKLFHSYNLELNQHNNQLKPSCWILQSALFAQLIIMQGSSPLYKGVCKIFIWSAKS